jgi:hypothetical protein
MEGNSDVRKSPAEAKREKKRSSAVGSALELRGLFVDGVAQTQRTEFGLKAMDGRQHLPFTPRHEREAAGDDDGAAEFDDEISAVEEQERAIAEEQYWNDDKEARGWLEERIRREKLRAKLIGRSRGIFSGPIERGRPPRPILAMRQCSHSQARERERRLPPLAESHWAARQPG